MQLNIKFKDKEVFEKVIYNVSRVSSLKYVFFCYILLPNGEEDTLEYDPKDIEEFRVVQ